MEKTTITTLLLALIITGCQKQPTALPEDERAVITKQFEESDEKINGYFDLLENPGTSQDVRKQILCKDWPNVYYKQYAPALKQLSPQYTDEELTRDFDRAVDYYKQKYGISCNQ
ncbi:MAG TPA: hypothetical protein IAB06_04665 [Candidatus Avacidaminococcus intestinavium]|uniref:Lipoprotein n=1 Tax=Candidatus Avacidaminococcus intestinavium TaxID=2840684 RepID=A0A9D1SLS2_9FIRM|nr:hypothetical protein [Candidatus Avacidaminococcus intestinavium]